MKKKYIIGLIIVICAFGYLVWSSFMGSFKFAVTPAEFRVSESEYIGKIVKLTGTVKPESIKFDGSDYRFVITDGTEDIAVFYHGIVPNTFREGSEVVVTGSYEPEGGVFKVTEMLTKCASKYIGD